MKLIVTEGAAKVVNDGLRCMAPRGNDPDRFCNKLLARLNAVGQIAGNFLCDRCKQIVSVEIT